MQEKLFLLTSKQVARRLTEVFDFVWPTATAIWNLRWQVAGFVSACPDATDSDLAGRFIAGSGIRGANLRRACIDSSWVDQQQEFARFLLFEFCALYESWCEGALSELGLPASLSKELQYPTTIKNGVATFGIGHATTKISTRPSTAMTGAIHPAIVKNRKNSLQQVEQLMICYRYFKEVRNALIHAGGGVSPKFLSAESEYQQLTPAQLGVKEKPAFNGYVAGRRVTINLRGVVGFGDIVLRLVCTLDAELAKSWKAEQSFRKRWKGFHGSSPVQVPANPKSRKDRVIQLVRKLGLPTPVVTPQFEIWLLQERCIV
jgi:hypothetical protein